MLFQKTVDFIAGTELQQPADLGLREFSRAITLQRETFKGGTLEFRPACFDKVGDILGKFKCYLHGACLIIGWQIRREVTAEVLWREPARG